MIPHCHHQCHRNFIRKTIGTSLGISHTIPVPPKEALVQEVEVEIVRKPVGDLRVHDGGGKFETKDLVHLSSKGAQNPTQQRGLSHWWWSCTLHVCIP